MAFRIACSIDPLAPGLELSSKLDLVAAAGIPGIELWDARPLDLDKLRREAASRRLEVVNLSGNREFSLLLPEERSSLLAELEENLERARTLDCSRLMLLCEPLGADGHVAEWRRARSPGAFQDLVSGLRQAAQLAERAGVSLLLEALNTRIDHRGYFLDSAEKAFACVEAVGSPALRLLYDVYHMWAMGEDVALQLENRLDLIGHLHVADYPGRHQPGSGLIPFRRLASILCGRGYRGWIGLEFFNQGDPAQALAQSLAALHRKPA